MLATIGPKQLVRKNVVQMLRLHHTEETYLQVNVEKPRLPMMWYVCKEQKKLIINLYAM